MSFDSFYEQITLGLPYDPKISFGIYLDGSGYLRLNMRDGDRDVAEAHRTFSLVTREADNHAFMIFSPEDRGIGIAKNFFRNKFALYKRWGIERVRCSAGLDDGAYTWARYGFKVSPQEWGDLQPQLIARLYTLPMPWNLQAEIQRLIEIPDPRGLWTISDLSQNVTMNVGDVIGKTLTLGRALLYGMAWKGVFEFGDPECVERFSYKVEGRQ